MKQTIKLLVLLLTVATATSVYAAVGTHNALISVGGGLNYSTFSTNKNAMQNPMGSEGTTLGGGYIVELGYLYLKDVNNFVHGVDTRLSFGQNFNKYHTIDGNKVEFDEDVSQNFNSMYFQVGTTYQFGFKTSGGRLMLDVLGLNLGYFSGDMKNTFKVGPTEASIIVKTGKSFLIGINLPLGVNYIFDNGCMIGFRHRLDIAIGGEYKNPTQTPDNTTTTTAPESGSLFGSRSDQLGYLAYNLAFSVGFAFGK